MPDQFLWEQHTLLCGEMKSRRMQDTVWGERSPASEIQFILKVCFHMVGASTAQVHPGNSMGWSLTSLR